MNVGLISATRRYVPGGTGSDRRLQRKLDRSGQRRCGVCRDGGGIWTKFSCGSTAKFTTLEAIVTDRLRSYRAATREIGNEARQVTGRWLNIRAENSHQPLPRDESARWRNSGVQSRFRNLPRSTLQSTIISIRNVTSTAAKTSNSPALAEWRQLAA